MEAGGPPEGGESAGVPLRAVTPPAARRLMAGKAPWRTQKNRKAAARKRGGAHHPWRGRAERTEQEGRERGLGAVPGRTLKGIALTNRSRRTLAPLGPLS
jgi:hypothetical protein